MDGGLDYDAISLDADTLGLETFSRNNQSAISGIYDGNNFVFIESRYGVLNKLKMLWRYGFFSLWNLDQSLSSILERFVYVYRLQDEGKAFRTVPEMLTAIGGESFFRLTQSTAEDVMQEFGVGELLIKELVSAVTRNNYGQDAKVNGLTGYVSMAGADGGSLFSVKGGNRRVAERLFQTSNTEFYFNHQIDNIRKENNEERISYFLDKKNDDPSPYAYDAVILASPLENQNLHCAKCNDWPTPNTLGMFQQTIATFLKADINLSYFNTGDGGGVSDIFTTETPIIPFSSIGRQADIHGVLVNPAVYKVFSRAPMNNETIEQIFPVRSNMNQTLIHWLAYPHYSPPECFPPFVLDDGIFYVNAIEWAASAMEMSCIGGRNAALLAKDYFLRSGKIKVKEAHP